MGGPDAPASGPQKRTTTGGGAPLGGDEGGRGDFIATESMKVKTQTEGKLQKVATQPTQDMEVEAPEGAAGQVRRRSTGGGGDMRCEFGRR